MSTLNVSAQLISDGTKIAQAAVFEGSKLAVTYGKPIMESSTGLAAQAAEWASKNPVSAGSIAAGLTVAVAPGIVVTLPLSAIGFTAGGVQAGSLAAGAHSVLGNVVAGSLFAVLQSAGAGGAGLAVLNGAAQVGGLAVGVGNAG
ncbi:uncharacterized protein DSM5745_11517 [Aspergillus mulundensis]|uniref:Uncharacterized protein n=1 Tax=Aspergillus mulundensis TaxID=1810919 RepID=A0A3D8Q6I7_9EURO|nr:hypothetical protein DSM5745_11517 [Aspergillus mulundensis]RDW57433.1 hypothetical protein DSM5745_11517 [Aspergillus mulundensis]